MSDNHSVIYYKIVKIGIKKYDFQSKGIIVTLILSDRIERKSDKSEKKKLNLNWYSVIELGEN